MNRRQSHRVVGRLPISEKLGEGANKLTAALALSGLDVGVTVERRADTILMSVDADGENREDAVVNAQIAFHKCFAAIGMPVNLSIAG